ncbi:MAG TPA: tetratricopeptide repeat protein [Candidatus Acidoferrales bacterium]|nr:tetratricopeptide repeat protein [Candidatus Acidoferrales bacterium]
MLLLAAVAYWGASGKRSVRGASSQLAAGAKIHSLAVLPLENLSGDPGQEYFADGMTEELTTQLAKINALRVISHTSVMQYKGERRKSLPDIAKALNVDAVVEGSVLRVGDKVRINAQLVDARADKHLWAQSYERDSRDVLALQDDLASAIAREIDIHVTPPERAKLGDARAVNPAAHEAYLKGIYYWHLWNEEGWKKSVDYLEQAVKADPSFAAAHAALARTYADSAETWVSAAQAMPKAKAAADRALELDSANPEARTVLGVIKYEYDYDWAGAERDFQRAIADNPGYPEAHHHYGYLLNLEGRIDESLAQYEKARELDPLSFAIAGDMSAAMAKRAGPEKVLEHMHKLVDMDPNNWEGHFWLGLAYIGNGQTPEGIAEFEKVKEELDIPYSAGWLGYWYAVTGDRVRAQKMLDELHKQSKVRFVAPWYFGEVYLGLGDKDRAIEQFVKSYEERSTRWLMTLKSPMYDPLRADPRFIALLKKIHLDT